MKKGLTLEDESRCPPKLVNDQLYATDEIGYLKVKDKKARKEIKELRAEVENLTRILRMLGRTTITSRPLLLSEKDELCKFLLGKN